MTESSKSSDLGEGAAWPLMPDVMAAVTNFGSFLGPIAAGLAKPVESSIDLHASLLRQVAAMWFPAADSKALSGDKRFEDPLWQANPWFRALGEGYIMWRQQLHATIDRLPLQGRTPEQWHTMVDLLVESLAPTNTLAGNPAALRRAFDTGAQSLVAGYANWLSDFANNQGMPSTVDPTGFEVGKNLAATPGSVVFRNEVFELIQYQPGTDKVLETPCLYVPPQINRYYMIDLAPGRSFVEYAVSQGVQQFVMSWRNPGPEHADWGMDTYVGAIIEAIDAACDICGVDGLHLAGSCAGGISATCATAILGARGSTKVRSLTLMVAMIDTAVDTPFNLFSTPESAEAVKRAVQARKVMDGKEMAGVFAWMRPNEMIWNYWVNNYLMGNKPPSFDMLVWNKDTTRMPARFHSDVIDLGTQNFLMKPGTREMLGEPVDLGAIQVPLYVIGGLTDHIAPWRSCYAATQATRGPSTFVLGNGGHIQSIIAPPSGRKASYYTREGIPPADGTEWLEGASLNEGSWWPHWREWLHALSGRTKAKPRRLGSASHAPLADAPGTYVLGQ